MKKTAQSLGFAIDWSASRQLLARYYREPVAVSAHARARLVYKKTGVVNWTVDQTCCERAGDRRPRLAHRRAVEKREIPMYYMRITAYRGAARRAGNALRMARAR